MTLKFKCNFSFIFHESMGAVTSCNADKRRIGIYQLVVSRKMMKRDGADLEKKLQFLPFEFVLFDEIFKIKIQTLQKTQKVGSFFPLRLIGLLPRNPDKATINQSQKCQQIFSYFSPQ